MLSIWTLCFLSCFAPALLMPQGINDTEAAAQAETNLSTNDNSVSFNLSSLTNHPMKMLEDYLYKVLILGDESRTWRINRKALIPVIIGMGIKILALIPLALKALAVLGSLAILISKASLAISGIMLIRNFLGSETAGGPLGLNPLGFNFPQASLSSQDQGNPNRRTTYVFRGRSSKDTFDILDQISKAEELYERPTEEIRSNDI